MFCARPILARPESRKLAYRSLETLITQAIKKRLPDHAIGIICFQCTSLSTLLVAFAMFEKFCHSTEEILHPYLGAVYVDGG